MKELNEMTKEELLEVIKYKNNDIIELKKEIKILYELIESIRKG